MCHILGPRREVGLVRQASLRDAGPSLAAYPALEAPGYYCEVATGLIKVEMQGAKSVGDVPFDEIAQSLKM